MFKIKPFIVCGINVILILISWMFYKTPHGDEYLILFVIPVLFLFGPFVLSLRMIAVLFVVNALFFGFYLTLGVLNLVDVLVLAALLGAVTAASYLVRSLYRSFSSFHDADISGKQRKYNSIVNELESIDRRGRMIENELSRISRLYEITKRLVPVLKQGELLDALFDFLEENFKFQAAHLMMFTKEKVVKGISKYIGEKEERKDADKILDYRKVVEYVKKYEYKPFFMDRTDERQLLKSMKVESNTFMVFPLFVGKKLCAILAVEGASRPSYGRFRILTPQIALEFRKVELYEEVQELSIIDGLTEVYLRRYLMDRLEEEVDRAGRLNLTFSVAMIDVDFFKKCNDQYGHLVGDLVLKKIAGRLKASVREVDMIARYGGEEFCVVLPETTKQLAMTVAERLRTSIEKKEIKAFDESMNITVSIGVATYPEDGKSVEELIEKADTALYKAKRKGRNIVCTV